MKNLSFILFVMPFTILVAQVQLGIDIDGEAADNFSGYSVSLSSNGTRVAIGAIVNDGNGIGAGHVRIYDFVGNNWVQVGNDIDGEASGDFFGWSVSLSSNGNTLAIGAIYNDGNGINSGRVKVYKFNNNNWTQLGSVINGEADFDEFGYSVSLSADGNRLAVGAPKNDGNGTGSGSVYVYDLVESVWVQIGSDINGQSAFDESGSSISLSSDGNTIAIGASGNDSNAFNSGHTRIYELGPGDWVQIGNDIYGEEAYAGSGNAVALAGNNLKVAIGARNNDGNGNSAGHVRIFELLAGNWMQLGNDIDGESTGDLSGHSVSFSSNGMRVAIGSPQNSGKGQIRIYDYFNNDWTEVKGDSVGEANGDQYGHALSLSLDGQRIAIGAPFNDGNGIDAGHVRVFDNPMTTLPIEFGQFDVTNHNGYARLKWLTFSEMNNYGFNIEYSANGVKWETIGFVEGNLNSLSINNYQFIHSSPQVGSNYYRLKQIDSNGKYSFSEKEILEIEEQLDFNIFPNPTMGHISIQNNSNTKIKAQIIDSFGKIVLPEIQVQSSINLNISDFENGLYYLEIKTQNRIFLKGFLKMQ